MWRRCGLVGGSDGPHLLSPDALLAARPLALGLCFFFQAEDGIRDVAVTGVQTCALPILAILIAGLFATPAFANEATIKVAQNCQKPGQICFDVTISTMDIPKDETRDLTVTIDRKSVV